MTLLQDDEKSYKWQKFLNKVAMNLAVLTLSVFWHIIFILGMGIGSAMVIFNKISEWTESGGSVDIDKAWKLMYFGVIMGTSCWLAGTAIDVDDDTIVKMVSFSGYTDEEDESTKTITETDEGGETTTLTTKIKEYKVKKDLFAMKDMLDDWPKLFMYQRYLMWGLPYLYLGMIETAVGMGFSLLMLFYVD